MNAFGNLKVVDPMWQKILFESMFKFVGSKYQCDYISV